MQKNLVGPRYKYPVSDAELKRRLEVTQAALKKGGVDCLVVQSHSRIFDSLIRYFVDAQCGNYGSSLMVPADGGMVYIAAGSENLNAQIPPWARNVERFAVVPYCQHFAFTDHSPAKVMEEEIKKRNYKKIGFAGLQMMSYSFGEYLTRKLAGVEFVDFSARIQEITAVKSPEEWELIDLSLRIHERLLDCVPALLQPGSSESEIRAELEYRSLMMGCDTPGNIAVGSCKPGGSSKFMPHFRANRRIEEGDIVSVMLEVSGPGGMYGELARTYCLGEPTQNLIDLFEAAKESQHAVAAAAKPGVTGKELNRVFDEYIAQYGIAPNKRFVGHGQGYDMMESPAICEDETMALKEDMLLAIHPELEKNSEFAICCDNFKVTAEGANLLSRFPQKLFLLYDLKS